jgi:hypothetical protein
VSKRTILRRRGDENISKIEGQMKWMESDAKGFRIQMRCILSSSNHLCATYIHTYIIMWHLTLLYFKLIKETQHTEG